MISTVISTLFRGILLCLTRLRPLVLLSCALLCIISLQAQYVGGVGDGQAIATTSSLQILGRNIFLGGNGKGATQSTSASTQKLGQNIFVGGTGEGTILSTSANTQKLGQNIFTGGNGEGTVLSATPTTQTLGSNIFVGGNGEGTVLSASSNTQSLGLNIYTGGIGKGFSMSIPVSTPLPITLVSFDAAWQGKDVLTRWVTSVESNTDHFEIERSIDGNNFITVGTIAAAGNSSATLDYSFLDLAVNLSYNTPPKSFFYRLKTVDKDGKFQYSAIAVVNNLSQEDAILYSLYPNPANQQLVVESKNLNKPYSISFVSVNGKVLLLKPVASQKEIINVSTYPAGVYFIQVTDIQSKATQTFKILIIHP